MKMTKQGLLAIGAVAAVFTGCSVAETQTFRSPPAGGFTCPHDDDSADADGSFSFVKAGSRWPNNQVTYSFMTDGEIVPYTGRPSNLFATMNGRGDWQDQIARAFIAWTSHSGIQVTRVASNGDIRIGMSSFGGTSNFLGYAYYPGSVNGGDIALNSDYYIYVNETYPNIRGIGIHEIGHALGLAHSQYSTAVMWPTIVSNYSQIFSDDIDGIQSIYGPVPTGLPPSGPANLVASFAGSGQVSLQWADNANDEVGYRLERSVNGGSFSQLASLSINVSTYADSSLSPSTSYTYRVLAYNTSGDSPASNTASIATPAPAIAAPTNLTVKSVAMTRVDLQWQDNSTNETSLVVERSSGAGYVVVASLAANAVSYSDLSVVKNKLYSYRVRATNATDASLYSNVVNARTPRR